MAKKNRVTKTELKRMDKYWKLLDSLRDNLDLVMDANDSPDSISDEELNNARSEITELVSAIADL